MCNNYIVLHGPYFRGEYRLQKTYENTLKICAN